MRLLPKLLLPAIVILCFIQCKEEPTGQLLDLSKDSRIALVGNNLCSRMMNYSQFETEMYMRFPDSLLLIRNMCDGGDTPGFRPHSGRNDPWAFPGAEEFQTDLAQPSGSVGHLEKPDEWLTRMKADMIIAFFGHNESFNGEEGLENYKNELQAFIDHTLSQQYNGASAPQLALVSPIAFQDLSHKYDVPDGEKENANLEMYTNAMQDIAEANGLSFVNAFHPSKKWFNTKKELTIDGSQMNEDGYEKFADLLVDRLFGKGKSSIGQHKKLVEEAVKEKNWLWHHDYKIPNGVHVFGRRYDPFGPDNYPAEYKKLREMIDLRDQAIWQACQGEKMDLAAADAKTSPIPTVKSNFTPGDYGRGEQTYLYGEDAINTLKVPEGYKVELFASEEDFPDLANPVQISFDNEGRLWVATMPTYPHYKPGDPKPNDKLIILEDTDNDGKADKQSIWAENLHLPVGFEFAPEGVYVSQGTNLKLLSDTDNDGKADKEEIIMSGFDDHDTHHVISAFCADPSGAIYMAEGVFLHTNVETSYGPVRATNGGFYRYNPNRKRLERTAQLAIPNPWGIAFDDWGQNIFAETSGPAVRWMMPGSVKSRYGVATHKSFDLIQEEHKVRPTSGLEFMSSRHFPEETQGDLLLGNSIGFLGIKQHKFEDDGTGYKTSFRHDMIVGDDLNFRPVDLEIAPDGSLYFVDWHNVLIGHMQHNARDPYRDHVHGRIYRITYPSRPLVEPAKIAGATIEELLDNLKLPEYRTRYRTRRELRGRNTDKVLSAVSSWVTALDTTDQKYEHNLVEALWVTWGHNKVDNDLLKKVLQCDDFRARTAAVRVLRYAGHQVEDQVELLNEAALDYHGRVRLETIVAASWLGKEDGLEILGQAGKLPLDDWMINAYKTSDAHLNGAMVPKPEKKAEENHLKGDDLIVFNKGKEIYERDAYCGTCHQEDGRGLGAAGYPPLAGTQWVTENQERLIKLTLHGLHGPITVKGRDYKGDVPMTAFGKLLDDEEIAAVLSYVRNAFGNNADMVSPEHVKEIREKTKGQDGFWKPEELLRQHPHHGVDL